MPSMNFLPEIKAIEGREFDRLLAYLRQLDAAGWLEQSYCTDWLVYQVVSHVGSGSRIGRLRLDAWVNGGPPARREDVQAVWERFDSLRPEEMLAELEAAAGEYLSVSQAVPDEAGLQEVQGYAGQRPLQIYQLGRLHELVAHIWDVEIGHDRGARLPADAVGLLAGELHQLHMGHDAARAAELAGLRVRLELDQPDQRYLLELGPERARLVPDDGAEAKLALRGPAEEMCRFVFGRQVVPGVRPELEITAGSAEDLARVRRIFR